MTDELTEARASTPVVSPRAAGIRHFTDLIAWRKNHEFVLEVYRVSQSFPVEERYGVTSQLRRAATSITANIAEGFGRYHPREKHQFYTHASTSNFEAQNFLILARDLAFLPPEQYQRAHALAFEGYRVLSGLIGATRSFEERNV